jgi:hypothetical protein
MVVMLLGIMMVVIAVKEKDKSPILLTVLGIMTLFRDWQLYSALSGIEVTSLAKVMCAWLEQQVPWERIALVHTKAEGAGLDDGLAEEMTGLDEGLPAVMTGLVEGLATTGFPDGIDVGLDGLVVEGRLLGGIETAEICLFWAKTLVVYNIKIKVGSSVLCWSKSHMLVDRSCVGWVRGGT